ncbi:hypothetical protein B0H14DRAFT_2615899 [Mycena olivaceomarginata]|nr:hypothetical protein B0H14DRAFT_2615899 [Mycena olivaceomarginata]
MSLSELPAIAKPGKESWVYGTKKTFFEKRKQEWLRESEANRAGPFYDKVAKFYFKKYGYHLEDDQDFAVDIADPPDSRIGAWYRAEYGALLKTDKDAFKELFSGVLGSAPPKPQRSRVINFYSRKYYDTRVKERAGARLRSLQRRAELTGEAAPQAIEVISKVTAEAWDAETAAFRHECQVACEQEYLNAVRAWELSLADSPSRTPQEMSAALENAVFYLQPFVDAIQEKFGMCASILLAGPIGIRGGKIGVQSVHAGSTKGLAPVNWPDFNWQGFAEVERSETECKARSTTPMEEAEEESEPTGLPLAPAPPAPPIPPTPAASGPGGGEGVAVGAVPDTIDPDSNEEPAEHSRAEERVGGGGEIYDKIWQRDDRSEWTLELGHAHAAFEVGRGWGEEWAMCVRRFFDFEGQGEELWVARWWGWWEDQQPKERVRLENGDLSRPETPDWSTLARMYGNNGILQIMGSLVWWGKVAQTLGGEDTEEWLAAVRDVTWVLERLLESGEIKRAEDDRDNGHASDDEDAHNEEEAAPSPKQGNGKRKRGAAKKNKSGEGAEDEAQPAKKKAAQEGGGGDSSTSSTIPRRTEWAPYEVICHEEGQRCDKTQTQASLQTQGLVRWSRTLFTVRYVKTLLETVTLVSAVAYTKWRVHSPTCGLGAGDGKQCYDAELGAEERKK